MLFFALALILKSSFPTLMALRTRGEARDELQLEALKTSILTELFIETDVLAYMERFFLVGNLNADPSRRTHRGPL